MASKKSVQHLTTVLVALLLGIAIAPRFNAPAEAKTEPTNQNVSLNNWKGDDKFSPPGRGAPQTTADGGSRGVCGDESQNRDKPLRAITPENSLALTVSDYPTFFLYVPESKAKTLKFSVLSQNGEKVISEMELPAPNQGGIIRLSLPASSTPLEVGQMYNWYLQVFCEPDDRSGDVFINGWIERIQPSHALMNQLNNASASDRPSIYARAGIWQEALTSLADMLRNNPEDRVLLSRWNNLLNSVGLGEFAQEPLIDYSQISQERSR